MSNTPQNPFYTLYKDKPLAELLALQERLTHEQRFKTGESADRGQSQQQFEGLARAIEEHETNQTVSGILAGEKTSFGIGPQAARRLLDRATDPNDTGWAASLGERTGANHGK